MELTFTIKVTEDSIPELIGLLQKMQANPTPGKALEEKPAAQPEAPAAQPAAKTKPKPAPTITAEQIQAAAGAFMDAAPGNLSVLQSILAELGVQSLPQLKPDQLQLFAASLRGYGVSI